MSLPTEAISLLKAAAESERGMIMHGKHWGGETIRTEGHTFTDGSNIRILATWRNALERLLRAGLVTRLGSGTVLQVTKRGYNFVETLEEEVA